MIVCVSYKTRIVDCDEFTRREVCMKIRRHTLMIIKLFFTNPLTGVCAIE